MASIKSTKAPSKAKAEVSNPTAPASPKSGGAQPGDAVAKRAYEIWRQSGGGDGNDQAHWFQAEREIRQRTTTR